MVHVTNKYIVFFDLKILAEIDSLFAKPKITSLIILAKVLPCRDWAKSEHFLNLNSASLMWNHCIMNFQRIVVALC